MALYAAFIRASAALLAVLLSAFAAAAQGRVCETVAHEGESYIVCEVDLRRHRIEIFWRDRQGQPFGSLSNLTRQLQSEGQPRCSP